MLPSNSNSKVTVIRRNNNNVAYNPSARFLNKDQERFSYNTPTTRILKPDKGDYKYSLRQNTNQQYDFSSTRLQQSELANIKTYRADYVLKGERPSTSCISYKSIDNKYGLIVRKVEKYTNADFYNFVFPPMNCDDKFEPYTIKSKTIYDDEKVQEYKNTYFNSEQPYENKTPEEAIKSDKFIFKRVNVAQSDNESVFCAPPFALGKEKHNVKVSSSLPQPFVKNNEAADQTQNLIIENNTITTSFGTYKGDIINNMMNGQGQLLDVTNFVIYEGGFKDNMFDGYGILFNRAAIELKEKGLEDYQIVDYICYYLDLDYVGTNWQKYEGIFKNDKKHKIGFWYFNNGDVFFGEFYEDKADGYGIYSMVDGSKVSGIWKDNKLKEAL